MLFAIYFNTSNNLSISIKDNKIKVSVDNKTTTKTITSNQEDAWNKLQQLKKMLDSDLITEEEFQNKKKEIIDSL